MAAPHTSKRRLPLVSPEGELSGKFPRGFETAVRSCKSGDQTHRALTRANVTLAQWGIRQCLPPKVRARPLEILQRIWQWPTGSVTKGEIRSLRAEAFELLRPTEMETVGILEKALPPSGSDSPLHPHSRLVTLRYASLSVVHSLSAVVQCVDAISAPLDHLKLPGEVAGGIAYRNVGLGPARTPQVLETAESQAEWEFSRVASSSRQPLSALALQLYHENLGVRWHDEWLKQQARLLRFIEWVFPTTKDNQ